MKSCRAISRVIKAASALTFYNLKKKCARHSQAVSATGASLLAAGFLFAQDAAPPSPPGLTLANGVELQPLLPDLVPMSGIFWSLQMTLPPTPFDPFPNLPVYALPDGGFIYDDSQVDYVALQGGAEMDQSLRSLEMESGVPSPPGGGGGGGGGTNAPLAAPYSYPSNTFYIEIVGVSNSYVYVKLHGTVPSVVYDVLGKLTLTDAVSTVEQTLVGATGQNWSPAYVAILGRTNLFLEGRSWVDSDGSGLPDWWQLKYFGHTGVDPYGDPDADGWTNLQEMQNQTNPLSWNTPPAPTGLLAAVNVANATNATLGWPPGNGNIQQYRIYRNGSLLATISATNTHYVDGTLPSLPSINNFGVQEWPAYQIQAIYAGGVSTASELVSAYDPRISAPALVVRGPQGRLQLVLSALPNSIAKIRVYRDVFSIGYQTWQFQRSGSTNQTFIASVSDGSFDVSITNFLNGAYQIPDSQAPPFGDYQFYAQAISISGGLGAISGASAFNGGLIPFIDGTAHLKNNLLLKLRGADAAGPFGLAFPIDDYDVPIYEEQNNYLRQPRLLRSGRFVVLSKRIRSL
jgi:hypothetical protein